MSTISLPCYLLYTSWLVLPERSSCTAWERGGCNPTSRSLSVVTLGIYRHLAAAVSLQSGLRGILSPQVIDEPRGVGESLADTEALIQVWHGRGEGQIYIWVRFHAPYSGHPESFVQGSALAQRYGVGLHHPLGGNSPGSGNSTGSLWIDPGAVFETLGIPECSDLGRPLCACGG